MIRYAEVHKKVRENLYEATSLLQECIRIPSLPGDEKAMGEKIMEYIKSMGLEVQNIEAQKDRPNLISEWRGSKPGRRFVFHCGLDVIPPVCGYEKDPWSGEIRDGEIYGRGSSDMKVGLCAVLMAVKLLREMGFDPCGSVLMSFVSDSERYGTFGVKELLKKNLLTGDFGICPAASDGKIRIKHCGSVCVGVTYTAEYKWAYLEHEEKSAIEKAIFAIQELTKFAEALKERAGSEFKEVSLLSVTELEGGVAPNIQAPITSFTIDRRLIPGETADEVHKQIIEILEKLKEQDSSMEYTYEVFGEYPCLDINENEEVVVAATKAYKNVFGREVEINWSAGGSDASDIAVSTGMPIFVFSPGKDNSETYSADERANLEQYYSFIEIYMLILIDLLSV